MRLEMYTEKTVAQCLSAINERMQAKGTGSRPGMDGWVEKSGAFAVSITTPVAGRFQRRTTLHGKLEKAAGFTVVHIDVASGATKQGTILILAAVALIALTLIGSGNVMLALALIPLGAYLYIPMRGDHENSSVLVADVQRTLKARNTPPKKPVGENAKTRVKG